MKKEQALKIIFQCADKFEKNLANKNLLFVCSDKKMNISTVEVAFIRSNFLHMTGVKFNTGKRLSANEFYKMCLDRRLSLKDFELASDGTTDLKLVVLPALVNKNLSANMIGEYSGSRPMLFTQKIAGNIKGCMGFLLDNKKNCYVPNTILNEDVRTLVVDAKRVVAVFRKDVSTDGYEEIVYKVKDVDLKAIALPKNVKL